MNRNPISLKWLAGLGLVAALLPACNKEKAHAPISDPGQVQETALAPNERLIPGQYIVWLHDEVIQKSAPPMMRLTDGEAADLREVVAGEGTSILRDNGIPNARASRNESFSAVGAGFVIKLSPEQAALLRKDSRVRDIVQDRIVSLGEFTRPVLSNLAGKGGGLTKATSTQSKPWGITRVSGGTTTNNTNTGWILDTGIDSTHPDLNVIGSLGKSFLSSSDGGAWYSTNDEHGHGTHVSGTIGAKNNTFGVVGVCPGARVAAVRVLNKNGSGTLSGVIKGLDYVALKGKAGDVANMSLGGSAYTLLDDAVKRVAAKQIYVVVAAGNSYANAANYSPARVNAAYVYTISAMDNRDWFATFSNYGTPVDYCAPGVSVLSTYKGGAYATMSGTSMATPHIAGIILAKKGAPAISGYVKNDPDGNADPIGKM